MFEIVIFTDFCKICIYCNYTEIMSNTACIYQFTKYYKQNK